MPPVPRPEADNSFLSLLADIEKISATGDHSQAVRRYQAWIKRNSVASPSLFAAWFNIGSELAGAGDKPAAIDAYRHSLALRPEFYPAAFNLGLLLESTGRSDLALAAWRQALQPEEARAELLARRQRLAGNSRAAPPETMAVLHIGYGASSQETLPPGFRQPGWREIRLDIDPDSHPDIAASLTGLRAIADAEVDAVYASCCIEHLHPHEVKPALQELHRVLKPAGHAIIAVPDLQEAARHIAAGRLEDPLYASPAGPIAPIDMLYGHRASMADGKTFMAHRTGFTRDTLAAAVIGAGFAAALVKHAPSSLGLTAIAFRTRPAADELARMHAQTGTGDDQPALFYTPNS